MYRKILLTGGDLLEFFKAIYFFVECLAVIAAVPAAYPGPSPRASPSSREIVRPAAGPAVRGTGT